MTTPRLDIPGWEHLPRPDLHGSTVVLTGGSDGIGREAALRLAHWGARLVLPVRTRHKGEAVAARLRRETGREDAATLTDLDLADLDRVRVGAAEIREATADTGIDLLVHVAGGVTRRREETVQGFEWMTGVNALAPVLLTELLLPAVRGRVVITASAAHHFGRLDGDDPHFRTGGWSFTAGYGRSKLLAMLWGLDLSERLRAGGSPVDVQLVHPGWVLTNLQNATGSVRLDALLTGATRPLAMPAARGAESVLVAATQPLPAASYVGPDGPRALRGDPTLLPRSAEAADVQLAARTHAWMREELDLQA